METETIDKLFLELSQFSNAITAREVRLMDMLKKANEILRSAKSIADRKGESVNWEAFTARVDGALKEQHSVIYSSERNLDA